MLGIYSVKLQMDQEKWISTEQHKRSWNIACHNPPYGECILLVRTSFCLCTKFDHLLCLFERCDCFQKTRKQYNGFCWTLGCDSSWLSCHVFVCHWQKHLSCSWFSWGVEEFYSLLDIRSTVLTGLLKISKYEMQLLAICKTYWLSREKEMTPTFYLPAFSGWDFYHGSSRIFLKKGWPHPKTSQIFFKTFWSLSCPSCT